MKTPALNDIERARAYVQQERGHWTGLAARTGLNPHWIVAFGRGKFSQPGYDKIAAILADMKTKRRKH